MRRKRVAIVIDHHIILWLGRAWYHVFFLREGGTRRSGSGFSSTTRQSIRQFIGNLNIVLLSFPPSLLLRVGWVAASLLFGWVAKSHQQHDNVTTRLLTISRVCCQMKTLNIVHLRLFGLIIIVKAVWLFKVKSTTGQNSRPGDWCSTL